MADSVILQLRANLSFRFNVLLYISLIAAILTRTLWLEPPQGSILVITLIQIVPLLLPVTGLFKRGLRAASWLCFILCFYFINAVLAVWFVPESVSAWVMLILVSMLFINSMMFIRWQGKLNRNRSAQIQ